MIARIVINAQHGMIVVRRKPPEGRLSLVVVEAEDLILTKKGNLD